MNKCIFKRVKHYMHEYTMQSVNFRRLLQAFLRSFGVNEVTHPLELGGHDVTVCRDLTIARLIYKSGIVLLTI